MSTSTPELRGSPAVLAENLYLFVRAPPARFARSYGEAICVPPSITAFNLPLDMSTNELCRPHPRYRLRTGISWSQQLVKSLLRIFPKVLKPSLFEILIKTSSLFGKSPYHNIFRLPFNLVLKTSNHLVEADALRFVGSLRGINAPALIDSFSAPQKTYILSTWVEGDCCADVWERLTPLDKEKIVEDMRSQYSALQQQTSTRHRTICNASGGAIQDPRVPWIDDNPRTFPSYREFMEQVWLGLNFRNNHTLAQSIARLIERDNVPIVFSHGDALPKNLILPGGLDLWRRERPPLYIIDWEYAGWMPLPWEALKATWLVFDKEEDCYKMMVEVFPDSREELAADWEWRTRSGIPIV
ncbi:unnamed protein product [Cyclocybe aegerita]|uniref:Aminoglycoside phosphotransferase domain-containing protein n=1 Tax=Cyclocybe aegerita TaxID=1973307 RepID=A0A8S0VZQ0_CYCAE|nr:unnamed protein product [Cyclocybe aegerita]